MADLKTKYMGLELRSPIIAGSCGLTSDVEKMVEMEKAGVGAVVLKSIFEEQINEETSGVFKAGYGMGDAYPRGRGLYQGVHSFQHDTEVRGIGS